MARQNSGDRGESVELKDLLALEQEASDLDASRIIGTLRRRWIIVLIFPILLGVLGYVLAASEDKIYESQANVVLRPTAADTQFVQVENGEPDRELQTETAFISGAPFQTQVSEALGRPAAYRVTAVFRTSIVAITGRSTSPVLAAETANTAAELYVAQRRDQIVDGLTTASSVLTTRINGLQSDLDAVNAALAAGDPDRPDPVLNAQQRDLSAEISSFKSRLSELEIGIAVTSGGARVASAALPSDDPVAPKPTRQAILFAMLGLLVGIGAAIAAEAATDTLGSADDLERRLHGVPLLASVPSLNAPHRGVLLLNNSQSASAESIRSLRTSLQFLALDGPLRRIQVTSASNDEGATVTAANLAVAFAGAGLRVTVVDGDLRTPALHTYFGVDGSRGFTTVLVGQGDLNDVLQPIAMQGWLRVLAAGPRPTNPSELLASGHLARLLTTLEERCDLVIIDSPPVLPYTDAAVIASFVDATVVVASAETSKTTAVQRALRTLRVVEANIAGVVISNLEDPSATGKRRDKPTEASA